MTKVKNFLPGLFAAALLFALLGVASREAVSQAINVTNCNVNSSAPTYTSSTTRPCSQTTGGAVRTEANGSVASGATDSGNPVKVGGVYNSTKPTLTNGQRGDLQLGARGALYTHLASQDATTTADVLSSTGDSISIGNGALVAYAYKRTYNGSGWDKDFVCGSQASATITAGNTTEVVALTGSQIIRVCSAQVGIATTGTYKFVSGTGTNCGTGTADITPATTLTAGNVIAWGSGAASIFRSPVSNALCVTAVTGNVQVFVSYAKY